ncbi:MAG: hypothetical protein K6E30_00180 [Lachnospiraceae bacterium]|nr:hypothetical protein [Lachnospiraceae bacterium]
MLQRSTKKNHVKTPTELYFEQVILANEALSEYRWRLQKADQRAYGLSSPSGMANTKVQVSADQEAAFTRKLEKKDDLARQLSARIRLLESLIRQASGLIDQYTSGQEKKILQLRYLKGYEWLQVSNEVRRITPKQLRNIARKGLAKIVLPEDAIWIEQYGKVA